MSKKKGGWQKLKESEEKRQRFESVVHETPTFHKFFSPTSSRPSCDPEQLQKSSSHKPEPIPTPSSTPPDSSSDISTPASTEPIPYSNDPGEWDVSSRHERFIDNCIEKGLQYFQNVDADFSATKRAYQNQNRYLTKPMFEYVMPNKSISQREWLLYSPSKQKVFCFYCLLFCTNNRAGLFCVGFNYWKNQACIAKHAMSQQHTSSVDQYLTRKNQRNRIDVLNETEFQKTRDYWKNVLRRVYETILFLAERGLPFRGSDDLFGSKHNGNYFGILELIAKFDPFLAQHINNYAKRGTGNVSYLSKTICNDFLSLMADKVLACIISEIKSAQYFTVSVDSLIFRMLTN